MRVRKYLCYKARHKKTLFLPVECVGKFQTITQRSQHFHISLFKQLVNYLLVNIPRPPN